MPLSAIEIDRRYEEAKRAWAESTILKQWYWSLREMRREQDDPTRRDGPHWIIYNGDVTSWLIEERVKAGGSRPEMAEGWIELFIEFINDLIGDQLRELGLVAKRYGVPGGFAHANRIYLLPAEE